MKLFGALVVLMFCALPVKAATFGITVSDRSQTYIELLAQSFENGAPQTPDLTLDMRDAQGNRDAQIEHIQAFVDAKVDAIIVNSVNTDIGLEVSRMAAAARIPLVFVNQQPINLPDLPRKQAYVGSDERESGKLELEYICQRLEPGAQISILVGNLESFAARQRTQDYYDLLATETCSHVTILDEAFADWTVEKAQAQVADWIAQGRVPNAIVANNDDMALGAIAAVSAAGIDHASILIGGIDATAVALEAMARGELDVTVKQDAAGQARATLDAALQLASGKKVDAVIFVPFELIAAMEGGAPAAAPESLSN